MILKYAKHVLPTAQNCLTLKYYTKPPQRVHFHSHRTKRALCCMLHPRANIFLTISTHSKIQSKHNHIFIPLLYYNQTHSQQPSTRSQRNLSKRSSCIYFPSSKSAMVMAASLWSRSASPLVWLWAKTNKHSAKKLCAVVVGSNPSQHQHHKWRIY